MQSLNTPAASLGWRSAIDGGQLLIRDQRAGPEQPPQAVNDLAHLRQFIAAGALVGAQAQALAGAYMVAQECWQHGTRASAIADVDELEAFFQDTLRQVPQLSVPSAAWNYAAIRLQDCFDQHQHLLDGSELRARLIMEARRLQQEAEHCSRALQQHVQRQLPTTGALMVLLPGDYPANGEALAALLGVQGRELWLVASPHNQAACNRVAALARSSGLASHCLSMAEARQALASQAVSCLLLPSEAVSTQGACYQDPSADACCQQARAHSLPVWVVSNTVHWWSRDVSSPQPGSCASWLPSTLIDGIITEVPVPQQSPPLRPDHGQWSSQSSFI